MSSIIHGDCIDEMKKLSPGSVDLICTDPPYGIGFMGKEWDTFNPEKLAKKREVSKRKDPSKMISNSEARGLSSAAMDAARYDHSPQGSRRFREWWHDVSIEMLRVLKPGAFAYVCIGARQDSVAAAVTAMTEAGFKTDFTSLFWTYASGFPKAGNIGKLVDKRLGAEREVVINKLTERTPDTDKIAQRRYSTHKLGEPISTSKAVTEQAKALDGSYAGFQPKPAVEVIIVAMKPLSEKTYVDQALKNGKGVTWLDDGRIPTDSDLARPFGTPSDHIGQLKGVAPGEYNQSHPQGRFPANLLVSDDVLNDGRDIKSGGTVSGDEPSANTADIYGKYAGRVPYQSPNDSGSYSRYFDLDKWADTLPFLIAPKASKREKNDGLDESKNHHPTVKPLKLMSYLITLGSREGDIVLDPFAGSGTTVLAARKLRRNGVGIEREAEYVEIAQARLEYDKQESLL